MTLEIEANAADLETQVLISSDRRSLFIPCMVSRQNYLFLNFVRINL